MTTASIIYFMLILTGLSAIVALGWLTKVLAEKKNKEANA